MKDRYYNIITFFLLFDTRQNFPTKNMWGKFGQDLKIPLILSHKCKKKKHGGANLDHSHRV